MSGASLASGFVRRRWLLLDLVVVVAFVLIGRSNHHHGESLYGVWTTTWPFVGGVAVAWALLVARRLDGSTVSSGVFVGVTSVAIGMVLRVLAGQGTAFAFIVVALVFVGGLMVFLRFLRALIAPRRARDDERRSRG